MLLNIRARPAAHMMTSPLAVALLALVASTVVIAKPLDAETCQRLKGDVQGLEQQGIRDLMAKGPQTAKSLNATQLDKIRMLMDLDGQVRFRCGEMPAIKLKDEPPEEPQEAGAGPATLDNSTPGITLPPGAEPVGAVVPPIKRRPPPPAASAAKPAAAPPANAKVAPAAQPAAPAPKPQSPPAKAAPPSGAEKAKTAAQPASTDGKTPAPAPAPKATPAKKAEKSDRKVDDAYRPPATSAAPSTKTE